MSPRERVTCVLSGLGSTVSPLPTAPCTGSTFFCHSSMCINNSLVCNGIQNCAYPWDESHCRGEARQLAERTALGLPRERRPGSCLPLCRGCRFGRSGDLCINVP